ncbi:MAG: hypothetical protein J6N15_10670 [Ruminiclostridium sp.]|nr:hypothetical protein [Ruminiclostridium sp.]
MSEGFTPGKLSYTCFLNSEGKCIYTNNPAFFKRFLSNKKFREDFPEHAKAHKLYEQTYTSEGIKYRIDILPVSADRSLAFAYPEDCYIKLSYSEMYMRLFNINRYANRINGTLVRLKDFINSGHEHTGEEKRLVDDLENSAGQILDESSSVLGLFDLEYISRYVNIAEKLRHTEYCIAPYNNRYGKCIKFEYDIDRPVAKLNYTVLETAVFGTVALLYKSLPVKGTGKLKFRGNDKGELIITAKAKLREGFDRSAAENDIRTISCSFEALSGNSEVFIENGSISVYASVPAHLSNHVGRLDSGLHSGGDDAERLNGYSFIIAPEEITEYDDKDYEFTLNSPRKDHKSDFSVMLAEFMLGDIVFEF